MALQKDLKEFLTLLKSNNIRFLIIGAHAVAFHGFPRITGDIDILVEVNQQASRNLEKVFAEFGFKGPPFIETELLQPNQCFQLGRSPNRIDVLTGANGVDFESAWEGRVKGMLDDVEVSYISLTDLIANKKATGRPKDLLDIEELKRRSTKVS